MYTNYYSMLQTPYYTQNNPLQDNLSQLRNQQLPQMPTPAPTQQNNNGLVWVQGETGAKSFLVAPNTTVMLMDSENSVFYLKSADASGMPQPLRIFDYTERTATPQKPPEKHECQCKANFVTVDEFKALQAKFDALTNEFETLGMKKSTKPNKTKEDLENE